MRKTSNYSGRSGLYCSVKPVKGLGSFLEAVTPLLEGEGVSLEPREEMHCTVMYSTDAPHSIRVIKLLDEPPYTYSGWSDCLDWWEGHDKEGYLVLRLNSRDLAVRHAQYKELGCTPTFSPYEAHITLAKGLKKPKCMTELNRMLKNLKFEITFNGENVEDLAP